VKVVADDTPSEMQRVESVPIDEVNGFRRFHNLQSTTIIFENLYILAYSADESDVIGNFNFTRHEVPVVLQIWPPREIPITWPSTIAMTDDDADYASGRIFSGITGIET
jgi:hypothetical protein